MACYCGINSNGTIKSRSNRVRSVTFLFLLFVLLTISAVPFIGAVSDRPLETNLGLTLNPSSVVIKVGEKASINVTVVAPNATGLLCFSVEGFPDTGFRITFSPGCTTIQSSSTRTILTVETTPAAAPQNVNAFVVATVGSQRIQAPLNIIVEPAMPAWIPWLGLLLFFLVLIIAVTWKPSLPFKKASKKKRTR